VALTDEELAGLLLESIPPAMAEIRETMRAGRSPDLTVAQFRALGYVGRHEGATLSALADHLGLSRPAASKLVQTLVDRGLVEREQGEDDRRQVALRVSPQALASWRKAREGTRRWMAERLSGLPREDRDALASGLRVLHRVLGKGARA